MATDIVKDWHQATCVMEPVIFADGSTGTSGSFNLKALTDDKIEITGEIQGLSEGRHGFHVHQSYDISLGCSGDHALGHFNPTEMNHGKMIPNGGMGFLPISVVNAIDLNDDKWLTLARGANRHTGDYGNVDADVNGVAKIHFYDPVNRLNGEDFNIIGKVLVVHAGEDDLGQGGVDASLTTGDAGGRLNCCKIVEMKEAQILEGGRCEKPTDGGTRPTCSDSSHCCGAAKQAGAASLTQIEICYPETETTYPYVKFPGAPEIEYQFSCLESGIKLLASSFMTFATVAYLI